MPGAFSPAPRVSDPDMHHGTCVTHVPLCIPGSLTSGVIWSRWRVKRSRHSWRMRNPQFYVSGKRPGCWCPGITRTQNISSHGITGLPWIFRLQHQNVYQAFVYDRTIVFHGQWGHCTIFISRTYSQCLRQIFGKYSVVIRVLLYCHVYYLRVCVCLFAYTYLQYVKKNLLHIAFYWIPFAWSDRFVDVLGFMDHIRWYLSSIKKSQFLVCWLLLQQHYHGFVIKSGIIWVTVGNTKI